MLIPVLSIAGDRKEVAISLRPYAEFLSGSPIPQFPGSDLGDLSVLDPHGFRRHLVYGLLRPKEDLVLRQISHLDDHSDRVDLGVEIDDAEGDELAELDFVVVSVSFPVLLAGVHCSLIGDMDVNDRAVQGW